MTHKQWLDNEYKQWVAALKECTVDNFKEHPMVRRMLSLDMGNDYKSYIKWEQAENIYLIEYLGYKEANELCGATIRMIYYAQQVLKQSPSHIVEIGGGVGQFYAILRALGYTGTYFIYDLPEVKEFQRKYLDEVTKRTGLNTELLPPSETGFEFCVSFYALGEFDDETKSFYVENIVKKCEHGLVLWNPHSGASDKITWQCKIEDEYPLTSPGNKVLTW